MKVNILIDSHGWVEYFTEGKLAPKYATYVESANSSEYVTPAIVLYEVYKRIKSVSGEDAALKAIAHILDSTETVVIDKKIALNAAEISLKNRLSMADAIIKAVAEETHAKIITGDAHFKGFDGVVFIE